MEPDQIRAPSNDRGPRARMKHVLVSGLVVVLGRMILEHASAQVARVVGLLCIAGVMIRALFEPPPGADA